MQRLRCQLLNVAPAGSNLPRLKVGLIYMQSDAACLTYERFFLHFPHNLLPRKRIRRKAYQHYLPNNLLNSLARQGHIHLIENPLLPRSSYGPSEVEKFPQADVWVFALLNDSTPLAFTKEFFAAIKQRASEEDIKVINLASHTGSPEAGFQTPEEAFPLIAKLRANGLTSPADPESYALLGSTSALNAWKSRIGPERLSEYEIQTHLVHRRDSEFSPYLSIERWILICGDLTVGIRVSEDVIIKQLNSLTYYLRDPRSLAQEYKSLLAERNRRKRLEHLGVQPLTFGYAGEESFWDARHQLCKDLVEHAGVELCSMDIIEDREGKLHLIDYNEQTWESAGSDLIGLWEKALLSAMHK